MNVDLDCVSSPGGGLFTFLLLLIGDENSHTHDLPTPSFVCHILPPFFFLNDD